MCVLQIVRIDGWERTSLFPHGHFVRTVGAIGDKETENEVLLLEHDVPFHRWVGVPCWVVGFGMTWGWCFH